MLLGGLSCEQPDECFETVVEARIASRPLGGPRRWAWRVVDRGMPDRVDIRRRSSPRHAMVMGFVNFTPARTSRMTTIRRHNFANDALPADIGAKIGKLREQRGWSKAELAVRSGVPRETISRLEAGLRPPLADTVLRLLVILLADQDDVELNDIVPDWPEADGRQIIGHGPRSRVRRRQLGLTAAEVAAAVGVSEATLSRFECDASATPSLLATNVTPHGDEIRLLRSEPLASVLRFADLADHEAFSDAEDWLAWPVQLDPAAQGR